MLPDFEPNPREFYTEFDLSTVEALKENRQLTATTFDIGVRGGWMTVADARDAMGLSYEDSDKIYLRGLNVIPEPAGSRPQKSADVLRKVK